MRLAATDGIREESAFNMSAQLAQWAAWRRRSAERKPSPPAANGRAAAALAEVIDCGRVDVEKLTHATPHTGIMFASELT